MNLLLLGSLNVKKHTIDIWQRRQNYFGKRVFVEKQTHQNLK